MTLLSEEENPAEAENLLREVIEARTQIYGYDDRETVKARRNLALSLHLQSRRQEAETDVSRSNRTRREDARS